MTSALALVKAARGRTITNSPMPMPRWIFHARVTRMRRSWRWRSPIRSRFSAARPVTLKLIGLTNPTVQEIIHRRIQGLPTLTSEQIGRLKNTAMSEAQILDVVNQGLSDQEAEALIAKREGARNHSNTGFVRVRGRKH